MASRHSFFAVIGLLAIAIIAYLTLFVVTPTQQALVLQFGEVRESVREPGLHIKIPFIQNVIFLDKRILDLNVPTDEPIVADKKRLVVDAFARYRIEDPVLYYQTVSDITVANQLLSTYVQSALRTELAKATFIEVVRDERANLMEQIRSQVSARARSIGIEVVDVKIRRADLPQANSEAIFRRMRTERQREAAEHRAEGEEQAQRIRSVADRDATILIAEARRDAEITRGVGDAERNRIFAEAFGLDLEFFSFYRSMQAYRDALRANETTFVLSPDSDFFRFFRDIGGVSGAAPSGGGAGQR